MNLIGKITVLFLIVFNINCQEQDIKKLVIIGEGPAGLSAAIYAARGKLEPLIIAEYPGGQLVKATIENWPGRTTTVPGIEISNDLRKHAKNFGTKFLYGKVVEVDLSGKPIKIKLEDGSEILTRSLIIATGSRATKLGCKGEEEFLGKGIAICATCDAPLFKNQKVVVIGGGFPSLREVDILTKYTKDITIINRNEDIYGPYHLLQKIKNNKNIKILNNSTALEFIGDDDWVTGVKILNSSGKEEIIPTQGIFVAIGSEPVTELFEDKIKLNHKAQILVHNDTQTSVDGVFAAGDVTSNSRHQAPIASAFGYMAAMDAEEYLRRNKFI